MESITIGMDLGDKTNLVCIVENSGTVQQSKSIDNNMESIKIFFRKYKGTTVAIEAGTHSPWISRLLSSIGCNVLVGNQENCTQYGRVIVKQIYEMQECWQE